MSRIGDTAATLEDWSGVRAWNEQWLSGQRCQSQFRRSGAVPESTFTQVGSLKIDDAGHFGDHHIRGGMTLLDFVLSRSHRPHHGEASPRWVGRPLPVYPWGMSTVTAQSELLRATILRHRRALDEICQRYAATNPRLFGSVARGDATADSDIDLLVDLVPGGGNELLRVSGIAEELSELLGTRVDVVAASLLRGEVSSSALADAVAV